MLKGESDLLRDDTILTLIGVFFKEKFLNL